MEHGRRPWVKERVGRRRRRREERPQRTAQVAHIVVPRHALHEGHEAGDRPFTHRSFGS